MTDTEVRVLLATINSIYPSFKVDDIEHTVKAWYLFLSDQPKDIINAALRVYVTCNKSGFAPSVGQLIQGVQELREKDSTALSAGEAWGIVYKAICRSGDNSQEEYDKLPPEIQKAVGSPGQLRAWALDDQFNEGVASSNFRRAYAVVLERKRNDALIPADVKRVIAQQMAARLEG